MVVSLACALYLSHQRSEISQLINTNPPIAKEDDDDDGEENKVFFFMRTGSWYF